MKPFHKLVNKYRRGGLKKHPDWHYYKSAEYVSNALFYSKVNMAHIYRAIAQCEAGRMVEHDLIEVEDDE